MTTESILKSETICPVLWKGLHVGTLGEVRPCCFWPEVGNLHKESLEEIWNCHQLQEARKKAVAGIKVPECRLCYAQEKRGQGSTRIGYLYQVKDGLKRIRYTEKADVDPWIVDLRMSNICNLKCRTCYSGASSLWQSEVGLDEGQEVNSPEIRKQLTNLILENAGSISEIYFAGGEPTIIPEDWTILETLLERGDTHVFLRYNTNLCSFNYRGKNIVDVWRQWLDRGGKLQLGLSVDGIGPVVEFVRRGTKWTTLDSHIRELVSKLGEYTKSEKCLIEFTPVVSTYTVLRIPEMIKYAEEVKIGAEHVLYHNILESPLAVNLRNLTDSAKQRVREELEKQYRYCSLERNKKVKDRVRNYIDVVIPYMMQDPVDVPNRQCFLDQYPEEFNEVNPELANWWLELDEFSNVDE